MHTSVCVCVFFPTLLSAAESAHAINSGFPESVLTVRNLGSLRQSMQCFCHQWGKDGAAGKLGWWLMPLRSGGSRGHTWYEKSGEMQKQI